MSNSKSASAPRHPMTFDQRLRNILEALSEDLRLHIASSVDSVVKELIAAAEAERASAIEHLARDARAEAEREISMRTVRLFAALDETVKALKRDMRVAEPDRTSDAVPSPEPHRVFVKAN
jgi:hypothetical protein